MFTTLLGKKNKSQKQIKKEHDEHPSARKKVDRDEYITKFLQVNNYKLTLKNIVDIRNDSKNIWTLREFRNYINNKFPDKDLTIPSIDGDPKIPEQQKSPSPKPLPEYYGLSKDQIDKIKKKLRDIEEGSGAIIYNAFLSSYVVITVLIWELFKFVSLFIGFALSILPALIISGIGNEIYKKIAGANKEKKYANYFQYLSDLNQYNERQRLPKQKRREEELAKRRMQKQYWLKLDGLRFEKEITNLFNKLGYKFKLTKASGDEGVDIFLNGKQVAVQCKNHNKPVPQSVIRDLYGAMHHHGSKKAILISTRGFTEAVKSFAKGKPIQLWDINTLINKARDINEIYI